VTQHTLQIIPDGKPFSPDDYREALTNAFMDMHESAPYASLASTVCVDDTD